MVSVVVNNKEMDINEAIAFMMESYNNCNTEDKKDIECDIRRLIDIKNRNNVKRETYFNVPEYVKIKKGVMAYD